MDFIGLLGLNHQLVAIWSMAFITSTLTFYLGRWTARREERRRYLLASAKRRHSHTSGEHQKVGTSHKSGTSTKAVSTK